MYTNADRCKQMQDYSPEDPFAWLGFWDDCVWDVPIARLIGEDGQRSMRDELRVMRRTVLRSVTDAELLDAIKRINEDYVRTLRAERGTRGETPL